jgi:3-mercaptopyruvate sulfurtransferase SseA
LSIALAKHLRDAGVKNVYVLKNGWTLWQAEKLPVTQGSAALGTPVQPGAAKASSGNNSGKSSDKSSGKGKDKGKDKLCTDCTN